MALDRIDRVAFVGFVLLVAATRVLEPLVVMAAFAGFLFSLSAWRLYEGRPWEALGWLAWVGSAALLAFDLGDPLVLTGFLGFGLAGGFLLLGSRAGYLQDVWSVESAGREA